MSDWEVVPFCLTCGQRALDGKCKPDHEVIVVRLLDVRGMWAAHDERVRVQREFEDRKLGEAA